MRKITMLGGCALLLAAPAFAQGETMTWLNVGDASRVTGVPVKRPVKIRLDYNPSTGIIWEVTSTRNIKSATMVESFPTGGTPGPNQPMMVGGNETAVFRVLIDKPGWAFVTFQQKNREGKVVGRGYTFRLDGL